MADPPDAATRSRPVVRGPGQLADIDVLVVEEPLEIRVEERALAVTMRTPGSDLELAAGFLLAEGVVDGADDLVSLAHLPGDVDGNTVVARVAGGVEAHLEAIERASRDLYASSACGICGSVSLDRVEMLATFPVEPVELRDGVLAELPEALRSQQPTFALTGGIHGAALVSPSGQIEVVREDVGRHNAVDKVLGWRLLQDALPVHDRLLVVSGRVGFEIVHKARVAGVGAIVAIGAASTLSVDLAERSGWPSWGFCERNGGRATADRTPAGPNEREAEVEVSEDLQRELIYGLNAVLLRHLSLASPVTELADALRAVMRDEGPRFHEPDLLSAWAEEASLDAEELAQDLEEAVRTIVDELDDDEEPWSAHRLLDLLAKESFWCIRWGGSGGAVPTPARPSRGAAVPITLRPALVAILDQLELTLFEANQDQRSVQDRLDAGFIARAVDRAVDDFRLAGRSHGARGVPTDVPAAIVRAGSGPPLRDALVEIQRWKLSVEFDASPDDDDGEWTLRVLERLYDIEWVVRHPTT